MGASALEEHTMKVTGSTVLITGANRGLGARLVDTAFSAGAAKVYAAARNPESISPAVVGDRRIVALALDITDPASVARAAEVATDVTILINNAGVLGFGDPLAGDFDLIERDMHTNFFGTLRVSRAFAPVLSANAPGVLVNVLTLIALAPMGPMAGYCASKAASHSITQSLRATLAPRGVHVLGAYPAGIDTDMLLGVDGTKADPAVVAKRIIDAINAGDDIVWPDDVSAGAGAVYLGDPRELEKMLS
jgi:NAD(P)-dependent dehydrogenase (short-subunit alcohol dehydrogenase family)